MTTPWKELTIAGLTAVLMWFLGWVRTFLAHRVAVSTPIERKVKKLNCIVKKQSQMLDAITDRQAMHIQATIVLANAVKLGDQVSVNKTLDMITACETQFMAYLTSHAICDDEADEAEEEPNGNNK